MTAPTLPQTPAAEVAAGPRPLRVLGLDLSITATGMALPDGATHTFKTRTADGDRRLQYIADRGAVAL
ncbi:hypothetical protein [Streptomyces sp. NPDC088789]|uniref:hypothetical protein n=1 Tax=Streptomyces sp. NPDC088789 TaxID=3365899 RepID=UPI00381A3C36